MLEGMNTRRWLFLIAIAVAVGVAQALWDHHPAWPRHLGLWIAATALVGGLLLGWRAWWLVLAGTTAFSTVIFVQATFFSRPEEEDQRALIIVIATGAPLVLGAPVLLGAAIRWLLRR
jgi:hypothetical protein